MTALDDRLNSAEPAPAPVDPSAAARVIAYYLPQYHPIPENDAWWGRGFTEWTNVTKARRRFPGHYQPRLAGELGYYDLRVPEVRAQQAELAREHGVEAFCYYHYWFGTSELLQRPLAEVVASGQPGLSFCVCWANETWTGIWHGNPRQTLIEQTYPGDGDHRRHFESLRPAFEDRRYLRVDGKPVFVVYKPNQVPDAARVCDLWREMAVMAGLGGLHLVGVKNSLEGAPLPRVRCSRGAGSSAGGTPFQAGTVAKIVGTLGSSEAGSAHGLPLRPGGARLRIRCVARLVVPVHDSQLGQLCA